MELTFEQQSCAFLWSIALGAAFGAVYGAIKAFRLSFCPGRAACFALDLIFMLLCSLALFLFMLAFISGFVRIYPIIGSALGFFAYRLSVGRLLGMIIYPFIAFCRRAARFIFVYLKKFAKKLLKIAAKVLYNTVKRIKNIFDRPKRSAPGKRDDGGYEKNQSENNKRISSKQIRRGGR